MAVKTPVIKKKHPDGFPTKIVGVTHEGRQKLLERCQQHGVKALEVVRDPQNRYDPDAVALEAVIPAEDGSGLERVRVGFLGNSDRVCMGCGKLVDGGTFMRSRTVKCTECGHLFQFTKAGTVTCQNEITRGGVTRTCGHIFETDSNKTVVCPTCFGDSFTRSGVASAIAEAIDVGIRYHCEIEDYTGGVPDEKGRMKTRGCNIRLTQAEADKPV